MSKQTTVKAPAQTPERASAPASPEAAVDRVAAVSIRADGKPDQRKGFEVLVSEDKPRRD